MCAMPNVSERYVQPPREKKFHIHASKTETIKKKKQQTQTKPKCRVHRMRKGRMVQFAHYGDLKHTTNILRLRVKPT